MADLELKPAAKRLSACLDMPLPPARDPWVTGVTLDSREVEAGTLFIALQGEHQDGHAFIGAAIERGASAVIAEHCPEAGADAAAAVCIPLTDARSSAGAIAARFYDHPSRSLGCIGVTGTNGKTSVTWYLAWLLEMLGEPAGYGGSLGWSFRERAAAARLTTEDAVTVQRRLAELAAAGARWVAMEVSSHALVQARVDAVEFDIAVLTNLTRDHLDYHGTMARYAAAKRRLFERAGLSGAVVNADDPLGARVRAEPPRGARLLAYGAQPDADLRWEGLRFHPQGVSGTLCSPWGRHRFELPLFGEFSVANAMAACAGAVLAGARLSQAIEAARALPAVPGRMQFVRRPGRPAVVIDFAHTPDAVAQVASALRRHASGRLLCVFGCGGERDKGKRPLMARAVETHADRAWITSDNPRSESPSAIAADIEAGFEGRIPVTIELDRAAAIEAALAEAGPGDLLLLAGKGHERYQELDGQRLPYSDLDTVTELLDRT